jgi:hypothetical protein
MKWFSKNKTKLDREQDKIKVEVTVSKEATKREIEKAKAANQALAELLEANHFTVQIYRTAQLGAKKAGKA